MENNQLNRNTQGEQPEERGFDITLFLLECLSHWKWFVLSLVVVFGFSVFYIMRQVPKYNVQALVLMIDKWSKSESDVLTQSLGITSGVESIFTEIEIMRSRTLIKKVVEDLDLYVSYESKGGLRNTPLYRNTPLTIRPDSTTNINQLETTIKLLVEKPTEQGKFKVTANYTIKKEKKEVVFNTDSLPYTIYIPTVGSFVLEHVAGYEVENDIIITLRNPKAVARSISSGLNIIQYDKNTLLLAVSYTTPIPRMGIDIINRMVYYYNEDGIAEKNRASNNTELFINNRLVAIQKELSSVEQEVEQYRTQRGLTDLSSEAQMYLQLTGESDKERSELDVQLNLIEYVEEYISNPANTYSPIPTLGISNTGLSTTITEYNKAIAEREKLLSTSSESNPVVQEFTQNINAVKANVLQGVASTRKNIELRKKDLSRQEDEIEQKIRNVPQYERELTDIMRQQRIKENLFVFLLEKREENALTQTLAVGDARMIDEPTSTGIVAPQKNKIFFLAFIIALFIPGIIIFLKRLMFPSFQDKVELERLTSIPVLAEIPHNDNEEEFFVVKEKSNGAPSELFRLLRNNIQFLFTSPDKKVVMVTSSVSREGKTFISSNLAISFALTGKKVLLIGLDIRRPKAAHYFGLSNRMGIVNYLSGQEKDIDKIIQPSGYNNLEILPGGPIPPNPNELLLNPALDELFAELRRRYDYIVVDSAPVGLVSDSYLIDRVVDANLFVTRAAYTSCSHIRAVNAIVHNNRLKSLYLCINDVDMTTRSYSYRRYGYSYGTSTYGSYGYADDLKEKKKKRFFEFFRNRK